MTVPAEMTLGDLNEHIATLPIDAKRIKGLGPVTGQISGAGAITAGTGFTIAHTAASRVYDITFNAPFGAAPTVIVCGGNMGTGSRVHSVTAVTASTFQVTVTGGDEPFNFVAFTTI